MDLLEKIKKKAVEIEVRQNSVFNFPVEDQKEYLAHFPEPRNLTERSFFQYKCQMKLYGPGLSILLSIGAFPLLLFYLVKGSSILPEQKKTVDAVFFPDGKPLNILPNELKIRFSDIQAIEEKHSMIKKKDRRYLWSVWKQYPFSFFFLLKCLIKIRYYRYEIEMHHPQSFIVCNEYSFTSSLLTDYCHHENIQHINVMHGEKVYFMMDSFFQFDRCYVWHEEYRKLLTSLRAFPGQFSVSVPDSLLFSCQMKPDIVYDYTYYLGNESGRSLQAVISNLEKLSAAGYKVAVRPHPRYSDLNELHTMTSAVIIEDFRSVSVEQSVLQTKHVISLFSTVLNQAYNNGVEIVIDDISDPQKFEKLSTLQYVMLSVRHQLLSEVLTKQKKCGTEN